MTYRKLLQILETLNDIELNQDITLYSILNDEFIPARSVAVAQGKDNDVLDEGHIYITFEG
jgi:hypothetical protein